MCHKLKWPNSDPLGLAELLHLVRRHRAGALVCLWLWESSPCNFQGFRVFYCAYLLILMESFPPLKSSRLAALQPKKHSMFGTLQSGTFCMNSWHNNEDNPATAVHPCCLNPIPCPILLLQVSINPVNSVFGRFCITIFPRWSPLITIWFFNIAMENHNF